MDRTVVSFPSGEEYKNPKIHCWFPSHHIIWDHGNEAGERLVTLIILAYEEINRFSLETPKMVIWLTQCWPRSDAAECSISSGSTLLALNTGVCRPRWLSWMRHPTGDQEVAGSTPAEVSNILSWRLIMKYFLRSFSHILWFKKGSCQFLVKECAQYWLTA